MTALRFPPLLAAWAQVAAELVNTRPRETDPPEKLAALDDLERLLARCPEPPPAAGDGDLEPVRALRPVLLAAFEAETPEAFAAAVNPLLAGARGGWRMAPDTTGEWALEPAAPGAARRLARRAASGVLVAAHGAGLALVVAGAGLAAATAAGMLAGRRPIARTRHRHVASSRPCRSTTTAAGNATSASTSSPATPT